MWRSLHTNRTLLPACLHTVVCQSTQACAAETSRDREYRCTIKARRKKALGKTSLSCLQFLAHQVGGMYAGNTKPNVDMRTHLDPLSSYSTKRHSVDAGNRLRRVTEWFQSPSSPKKTHLCTGTLRLIPLFIVNILIFCHWLHWYIISQWKTPTVSGLAHETALVCFKV